MPKEKFNFALKAGRKHGESGRANATRITPMVVLSPGILEVS